MKHRYHVLLQWQPEQARWCIEFGSYDRQDVTAERADYRANGVKAAHLHVITVSTGTQAIVDDVVAAFNGYAKPRHGY